MVVRKPGRVVELFAGVGGFRIGLERELRGFDPEMGWNWQERANPDWEVIWGNQWEPSTRSQSAFDCYATQFQGVGDHVDIDIAAMLDWSLDGNDAGLRAHAVSKARGDADTTEMLVNRWKSMPLPDEFELLVGGFPCQDYSVAKPLSQADGIEGRKGVLWWEIHRILEARRPPHVLLENVDRLLKSPSSQRGRDFAVMLACFSRLGYRVEWRVINAADYGYPQRRRRVFIYATLEDDGLHLPGDVPESDAARFSTEVARWGTQVATSAGVLAASLPAAPRDGSGDLVALGGSADQIDPYDVSAHFGRDERGKPLRSSPFGNAGVMSRGVVWTLDVDARHEGHRYALRDVLLPVDQVLAQHPEFVLPAHQLDFSDTPRRSSWNYHKGSKRELRTKPGGFSYFYTEGAVAFPEPMDQAARTVLTGEGGTSPSRFKLVVAQPVAGDGAVADLPDHVRDALVPTDDGGYLVYRRLTPRELERLDMFPDDWTAASSSGQPMRDGRRAFCVGNALVIGIVERIGDELAARADDSSAQTAQAG